MAALPSKPSLSSLPELSGETNTDTTAMWWKGCISGNGKDNGSMKECKYLTGLLFLLFFLENTGQEEVTTK